MKKFHALDSKSEMLQFFVNQGYLHISGLFDEKLILNCQEYVMNFYSRFSVAHTRGKLPKDVQAWGNVILDEFTKTDLYSELIQNQKTIELIKLFLGPDVAILNYDHLWINVPQNTDPVLKKDIHTDVWTGTGVNTLIANTYFTDADEYNGLSVIPGSHLQGLTPVRNRKPDPLYEVEYLLEPIKNLRKGDFIIWHSLLLHSTTGISNENIRISMSSRYTSPDSAFTSQERSLGHKTLTVGPMNHITRLVGNDYLSPFRTLGGAVAIERRLHNLYGLGDESVKDEWIDYIKILDSDSRKNE